MLGRRGNLRGCGWKDAGEGGLVAFCFENRELRARASASDYINIEVVLLRR